VELPGAAELFRTTGGPQSEQAVPAEPASAGGSAHSHAPAQPSGPVQPSEFGQPSESGRPSGFGQPTSPAQSDGSGQASAAPAEPAPGPQPAAVPVPAQGRSGSGRRKHDAKITVYVSDEELLALEQARLSLRAQHGLAVDRGRVVREAVAVLLTDFDARGADSVLVQRLQQERG